MRTCRAGQDGRRDVCFHVREMQVPDCCVGTEKVPKKLSPEGTSAAPFAARGQSLQARLGGSVVVWWLLVSFRRASCRLQSNA